MNANVITTLVAQIKALIRRGLSNASPDDCQLAFIYDVADPPNPEKLFGSCFDCVDTGIFFLRFPSVTSAGIPTAGVLSIAIGLLTKKDVCDLYRWG